MNYSNLFSYIEADRKEEPMVSLSNRLNKKFNKMMTFLDRNYFRGRNQPLQNEIRGICDKIVEATHKVEAGERTLAFNILYDLCFSGENRLRTCEVKPETYFYRMRPADKFIQFPEQDMWHIPFEKRHLAGNGRYGWSGFPTFYLASSVYGCWEELKRTSMDYSNAAQFRLAGNVNFIDMSIPNEKVRVSDELLRSLPITIACSLTVEHPDENFIPEYLIPQLVMECLIKFRKENPETDIIGIRYESFHFYEVDLLNRKKRLYFNYAIPPFSVKDFGLCERIKDLFICWSICSWHQIMLLLPDYARYSTNEKDSYKATRFGLIEKFLTDHRLGMLTYDGWPAPGMLA